MTTALDYFLDSRSDVILYELLEIRHPNFTQSYFIVRNNRDGLTVTLEDSTTQTFDYYPLQIQDQGDSADLDNGFQINLGDLGQVLPIELDAVTTADGMATKPVVIYRAYRSDDLTAPTIGPIDLEVTSLSFAREGASFVASAPYVNQNKTGESYNLTRFYMLRGFLT